MMRTIKEELLWLDEFDSFEEAKNRISNWVEHDYNRLYPHSVLAYKSPIEFEKAYKAGLINHAA